MVTINGARLKKISVTAGEVYKLIYEIGGSISIDNQTDGVITLSDEENASDACIDIQPGNAYNDFSHNGILYISAAGQGAVSVVAKGW